MQFEIDYVKGYEAKAAIVIDGAWTDIYIDFTVIMDVDIAMVQIEHVWLESLDKMIELPGQVELDLCEAIEQYGNSLEWIADYEASMADYYYDMLGER